MSRRKLVKLGKLCRCPGMVRYARHRDRRRALLGQPVSTSRGADRRKLLGNYKLVGRRPVRVDDWRKWGEWMEKADRRVALTHIGGVRVSTVFLGLDHAWGGGPPVLFETMVFESGRSSRDFDMRRYHTWGDAERGHAEVVALLQARVDATNAALKAVLEAPHA